ncbi:hypothetical protein [Rhodococcus sp. AW25M09]|uniref:hypothetical protein n=1 Tax=Rhodococcus sp. AW25M09 TaxID=1268303 RepID=UPI0003461EE9|nr:hypothetical protein [Rhodococcus sp. AW25M09]
MTTPILPIAHSADAIESAGDRHGTQSLSASWQGAQADKLVHPVRRGLDAGPWSTRCAGGTMTLTAATPSGSPELWSRYVDGAWESYSRHGVTAALDMDEVASGATTTLFYVVLDKSGQMLGGVRAQGPYTMIEQSHVLTEWEDSPGLPLVTELLHARLSHGIVEMKSAWVDAGAAGRTVSNVLARTALPTLELTGSRYLFASAADHVLRLWESSGGRIDNTIPAAAYPSEKYRTVMMWWDIDTLARNARPEVWQTMVREARSLCGYGQRIPSAA